MPIERNNEVISSPWAAEDTFVTTRSMERFRTIEGSRARTVLTLFRALATRLSEQVSDFAQRCGRVYSVSQQNPHDSGTGLAYQRTCMPRRSSRVVRSSARS